MLLPKIQIDMHIFEDLEHPHNNQNAQIETLFLSIKQQRGSNKILKWTGWKTKILNWLQQTVKLHMHTPAGGCSSSTVAGCSNKTALAEAHSAAAATRSSNKSTTH